MVTPTAKDPLLDLMAALPIASRLSPDKPYARSSPIPSSGRQITKEAFFRARSPPIQGELRTIPQQEWSNSTSDETKGPSTRIRGSAEIPQMPSAHETGTPSTAEITLGSAISPMATQGHSDIASIYSVEDSSLPQSLEYQLGRMNGSRSRHQAQEEDYRYGIANRASGHAERSNQASSSSISHQGSHYTSNSSVSNPTMSRASTRRGAGHSRNQSTASIPPSQSHTRTQSTHLSHQYTDNRSLRTLTPHDDPSNATHNASQQSFTGSDEMLMALLASQAALDCQDMPVGGWEEVDDWKKVCRLYRVVFITVAYADSQTVFDGQELSMLTSRLSSQTARFQREQKILTAARTLAKLNHSNKRMSKPTMESLEAAELKSTEAEKVGLDENDFSVS